MALIKRVPMNADWQNNATLYSYIDLPSAKYSLILNHDGSHLMNEGSASPTKRSDKEGLSLGN